MRNHSKMFAIVAVALWAAGVHADQVALDPDPVDPDTSLAFVLSIGSRLYPDWKEQQRLHIAERFYLGDTEYTAKIRRFVPDFRIQDGAVINYSDEMNNPAAQVIVYRDTTAVDSTWAFLNFPPHFSPRSFFTFQLEEIEGYESKSGEEN